VTPRPGPLDALATDILGRCGYRFTIATDAAARDLAYRLRYEAVIEQGWASEADLPARRECDEFDERAIHVMCWDGEHAVATGRLVLPPLPLPTERICGITIEPRGQVADVGRMSVARSHQSHRHGVFLALLARLHVEVRRQGYETACGLMTARARSMMRLLGVRLEVLAEERPYWGELRSPVRFAISGEAPPTDAP
jgi:hypothetical protein